MLKPGSQSDYWNDRFNRFRHTGWKIPEIYAYDQRIRIRSILRVLDSFGFEPGPSRRVLDIGCGTGDLIEALALRGAQVVGHDISSGAVAHARERLRRFPNVSLECADLQETRFEPDSFDLITSVTVLQHQVEDAILDGIIARLAGALRPNGRVLILEAVMMEERSAREAQDHYIRPRTRTEWITHFRRAGLSLEVEYAYPQTALTALVLLRRLVGAMGRPRDAAPPSAPRRENSVRRRLLSLGLRGFLALFAPLDQWIGMSTPCGLGVGRILLFRKFE